MKTETIAEYLARGGKIKKITEKDVSTIKYDPKQLTRRWAHKYFKRDKSHIKKLLDALSTQYYNHDTCQYVIDSSTDMRELLELQQTMGDINYDGY